MTQRHDDDMGRQIEREPTIHKMRQGDLPAMPWHTSGKPFGVSQDDWDRHVCRCGRPGFIRIVDRWYCIECWENGDDEDA